MDFSGRMKVVAAEVAVAAAAAVEVVVIFASWLYLLCCHPSQKGPKKKLCFCE